MSYYYHTPEPRNTDGALDAFVGDFPYGPICIVGCIWVVNIILYIIARCKSRKVHPRVWYLIFSLFKNIIIGLFPTGLINIIYKSSRIEILITSIALLGFSAFATFGFAEAFGDHNILIPGIALLGFSIIVTLNSNVCIGVSDIFGEYYHLGLVRALMYRTKKDGCCCYSSLYRYCLTKEKRISKMLSKIENNPPILNVLVFPNPIQQNMVVNYGSWEIPEQVEIDTSHKISIFKIKQKIEFDEEFQGYMGGQIEELKRRFSRAYNNNEYRVMPMIHKVPKYICFAEKSLYVKFWSSKFGRFLFNILRVLGLAMIAEYIFLILAHYQKVTARRKVSISKSYKFTPYQPVPDTLKHIDHDKFVFLDAYLHRIEEEERNAPGSDFNYAMPPQQPYPPGEAYPPQQPYPPGEGGPYYGVPPPQQQPPFEENLAGPTPPPQ
ncbi:hypothetical protein TVAG_202450 [Trichomonas vaginalis G3]|uniref:Uncharacterized protein n=1 Tax=Trichomonas vaginalis (strain ATCC PRA-98 / G3) TaxID=412133 RepID=A2G2F0_TRIV3|nr:hypothetical protein TVAGG3_0423310 [Trichomonas vaginalis G3]EAX88668.1 hypothetical protein TVAG_202450 [Trichomonas vaginalis G3]KAI5536220.1 hypothetical protein TVAGG3_0423310 [Trichomonas vaginalis G3]|eukprot:XP_001301598.1 hypothetical protein [Trichomonas vaginalis G3]